MTVDANQPPRRQMIPIPDGQVATVAFGDPARPLDVLFIHANGFNAHTYRAILAPLGATLHVLAIDLRGHGRSTLPTTTEAHRWQVYANDVLAVLAALGQVPRVLAGHSMGGATALLVAAALHSPRPRLVLFDPVLLGEDAYAAAPGTLEWQQPMAQAALRRRAAFASLQDAFTAYKGRGAFATWPDETLLDYLQDGLRALPDGTFTLACAPEWEAANFAAARISNPMAGFAAAEVQILKAEKGSVCFVSGNEPALAGVDVRTVAGTTHFLPMERGDLVRAAISK